MKKLENLGRLLNQKEQEKITGGAAATCLPKGANCYNYYRSCCSYCYLYKAPTTYYCA